MEDETDVTSPIELAVTVIVQDGVRHALVEWQPDNAEAVELAIGIACDHASSGYHFRGVRRDEGGGQQLWLVQQQPSKKRHSPVS